MAVKSKLSTLEIVDLYKKGYSVHDISLLAGISEAAIWKRLRKINYPMNRTNKGTHWRKNMGKDEFLGSDGRYWVRHYYKGRRRTSERRYIVVMEKYLGHPIPKGMVVHHIDENPTNDDINNLCLMTKEAHIRLHSMGKRKEGD